MRTELMSTLLSPTDRGFYSLKGKLKRPMRNSSSIPRTLRLIGQPSRPRSERIKIEKRKLPSDLFMKRADTDITPNIL